MKKIKTANRDCSGKYCVPVLSGNRGFTFMELVMVIVILGILSAVAIPKMGDLIESSKINATRQEMMTIKQALIGDATARVGAVVVDQGFIGDNHGLATNLETMKKIYDAIGLIHLADPPPGWVGWNKITRKGWNGPYIRDDGADDGKHDYQRDAWDRPYIFSDNLLVSASGPNGENTITSKGPDPVDATDDIIITY